MTNLLKGKSNMVNWTSKCNLSFQTLKSMLTQNHVLIIMDPLKRNIILCTDVNDSAIVAILMQDKKKIKIAYKSCKLNFVELNYPIHEKKLLAVIHSLKVWRHYLLGIKFKIETHHQFLRYLSSKPNLNR